jgi:hypothetical protein
VWTWLQNTLQGWAVDQQRLIFGGKQLDDVSPLAQYGITDLSILYLVLRAQEGTPSGDEPEPEPEPLEPPAFQVNVMTPAGTQCRVTLHPDSTIGDLKALVAEQDGMEASAVHRLFSPTGGPELQNAATLSQSGISDSSLLLLSPPEGRVEEGATSAAAGVGGGGGGGGSTGGGSGGSSAAAGGGGGGGGGGAAAAVAGSTDAPPTRLKRRVSFSESLQERVADDETAKTPLEHAEGPLKENDGPSIDSALLDRLIVAFFEKGNIRSADGVTAFVGQEDLNRSGAAVAERLEYIIETLRSGRRVGLLPSNARLGPEHSVRLARLLDYLNAAL